MSADRADWLIVLDERCESTSQNRVAGELGVSAAMISTVRKGSYRGRVDRIEMAVRGKYMSEDVTCPELGRIPGQDCVAHQRRAGAFRNTNAFRIRMFTACNGCPRYLKEDEQ